MSKATNCDWCGEFIAAKDDRVKLPVSWEGKPFTYCVECYVRVYAQRCLRALVTDEYPHGVGAALRTLLSAVDPEDDEE